MEINVNPQSSETVETLVVAKINIPIEIIDDNGFDFEVDIYYHEDEDGNAREFKYVELEGADYDNIDDIDGIIYNYVRNHYYKKSIYTNEQIKKMSEEICEKIIDAMDAELIGE